ncbi:helicase [Pseudomonas sp. NPDC096950]|uniref:helicase n=1 Tax=Pseudomonas sp. NPDC096950 TaxID=3364485 RepID=UPI00383A4103
MAEYVLYLPMSEAQADLLADPTVSIHETLGRWDTHELAAVAVVQNLKSLAGKPKSSMLIEKGVADLIEAGADLRDTHTPGTFTDLIIQRFNREAFIGGRALMSKLKLRFMDEETLAGRAYLVGNYWDLRFCQRHSDHLNPAKEEFQTVTGDRFTLSSQQARTFRVLQAEHDESIHIQALAGTGKTHLIERMINTLTNCHPLLLAFTRVQLDSLMLRVGVDRVTGMTFGGFANHVLRRDRSKPYRHPGRRSMPRHQVTPEEVALRLGLMAVGRLNPSQVASACAKMVIRFCHSSDSAIHEGHIPKLGFTLDTVEQAVLAQYAHELWTQTIDPTDARFDLPLRGYHCIKQMSLLPDAFIGHEFTHIIVDEAHDLTWPMASFLDRCPQPVISLGDACQRLDGNVSTRAGNIRHREITHSIRAGRQIEGVINSLIDKNPLFQLGFIEGNSDKDTKVEFYDRAEIPTSPTTILVSSEWGLFEWFQRLGKAGVSFSLLPGAVSTFRRFILDCIELFHSQTRPTHSALFRYSNWDDLHADMDPGNTSFHRVDRMLRKGYSAIDFEASLLTLDTSGCAPIKLGRVVDAKNMEIDTVMLAPDLLGDVRPGDRIATGSAFAALYTAGTRARHQLIVPGNLKDWASDAARPANRNVKD